MTLLSSPQQFEGVESPEATVAHASTAGCQQDLNSLCELSDAELDQHIADCGWHFECAYARWQAHGKNPSDRNAALDWLRLQNEAIATRDRIAGERRHAEFERRISEGVDYFQSAHALALGRGRPG